MDDLADFVLSIFQAIAEVAFCLFLAFALWSLVLAIARLFS